MRNDIPKGVSVGYLRLGSKPYASVAHGFTAPPPIQVRASRSAPIDMEPGPAKMERAEAIQRGFTGDQCDNCNSMRMQIAGHCMVCADCGTTTGCS